VRWVHRARAAAWPDGGLDGDPGVGERWALLESKFPLMDDGSKHEELERILRAASDRPHVVLLSGHPDPDSLGSAVAHQRLCERLGIPATVAHVLPVARSENRAIVKLLNIEMVQVTAPEDLDKFGYLSLVDTSLTESAIEIPDSVQILTVVDHHRPARAIEAPFVDIRLEVGATCSIYAEYFENGLAPLDSAQRVDNRVATAMLFGIQTDTDDFSLASPSDFKAAAYLKRFADVATLNRIGRRTISAEAMNAVATALVHLEVVRDFALAGVGRVSPINRDAIPIAAEFIMRREDIDTVLVYGLVENRIDGSLRTSSASVDPAAFLESVFGRDSSGRPYGGGRADKGGFQIPLGVFGEAGDDERLWELVRKSVRSRVARAIPDLVKADGRPSVT
jgi:nanoRNase/pAp phosphatase (c-di-AMP/oligoRNAs hydrolase)